MFFFLAGVTLGACLALVIAKSAFPKSSQVAQVAKNSEQPTLRLTNWRTYVSTYKFPKGVIARAHERCPAGTDAADLERGLRQFFLACGSSTTLIAAMPSKTVDEAWHEFITYTRDYADFCDKAFGQLLHHVPETTMNQDELDNNNGLGMVTSWVAACEEEGLPVFGKVAPTLFASDARSRVTNRGWRKLSDPSHTFVGFCGARPEEALATLNCAAHHGTTCMRHHFAPVWSGLTREVNRGASRSTTSPIVSDSGYDAVMFAALLPVLVAPVHEETRDTNPATESHSPTPNADDLTWSNYTPDPTPVTVPDTSNTTYSSCSSSSSSCSSSSSSCGGGGGCGGSS